MKPEACDACGRTPIRRPLVLFAKTVADHAWDRGREQEEGFVGHPPYAAWYCETHRPRADRLAKAGYAYAEARKHMAWPEWLVSAVGAVLDLAPRGAHRCRPELEGRKPDLIMNGRVMGDSCSDLWYECPTCSRWTRRWIRDTAAGDTESWHGPFTGEQSAKERALISRCANPTNDRCGCDAHRKYFES